MTAANVTYTSAEARGALPVLGHALRFIRDSRGFLSTLAGAGDLVWIRLGRSRALVVCDPELTRRVLVNDRVFEKGGPFVDRLREFIGESVSTCPRAEHRRQRRLMQPAFHHSRLAGYAKLMGEQIADVISDWRDGQVLDVYASMQDITTRITARTLFASPASGAVVDDARDALNEIVAGAGRRMLLPPSLAKLPTPGKRRYDRARTRIRELTDALIADYRGAGVDHHDLMSMLLGATDDSGGSWSEQEISDQVVTLFLGGVETVASTVGWALCLLAQDPEIQERLHREVAAASGDRAPAYEDLPRLVLCRNVIMEALRIYPPGWLLTRRTAAGCELGGHAIPAGTDVIYSPYLLQHRADLFPDPERFDPDRWDGHRPGRSPAFIPFGDGPRKCIGDTLTMVEAPLILASVVARWRLHPVEPHVRSKQRVSLLLTPRNLRVRISAVDARDRVDAPIG
jgi:cytochrome P450